jgi:hypothetical protein
VCNLFAAIELERDPVDTKKIFKATATDVASFVAAIYF